MVLQCARQARLMVTWPKTWVRVRIFWMHKIHTKKKKSMNSTNESFNDFPFAKAKATRRFWCLKFKFCFPKNTEKTKTGILVFFCFGVGKLNCNNRSFVHAVAWSPPNAPSVIYLSHSANHPAVDKLSSGLSRDRLGLARAAGACSAHVSPPQDRKLDGKLMFSQCLYPWGDPDLGGNLGPSVRFPF